MGEVMSAPTPESEPRRRLDHLDGVRALAALYVVLHHMWITTWPDYPRNSGPTAVGWLVYGHLAVSVFIVLSGFSLSIAVVRKGWHLPGGATTFIRRRAWRIIPTYWAALALSAVVFGVVTPDLTGDLVSVKGVLVHAVLLQDVINSPKPNGAFWSIAVEWQIYFLFPLILLVRRRGGASALLAMSASAVVGSYLLATHTSAFEPILNLTPQFALLFVFGVVAARVLEGPTSRAHRRLLAMASASGLLAFLALAIGKGSVWVDREYFWIDLLVGAASAAGIAWMSASGANPAQRLFSGFPMRNLGVFSYSLYCVHQPVMWLVWHFVITRLAADTTVRFLWLVAVGLPVVLGASWAFSLAFEKPFLTHRSWASLISLVRGRGRRGAQVPQEQGVAAEGPHTGSVEQ